MRERERVEQLHRGILISASIRLQLSSVEVNNKFCVLVEMLLILVGILLLILLLLFRKLSTANRDYFKLKGIVYSEPKSFIGFQTDVMLHRKTLLDVTNRIYREFSDEKSVLTDSVTSQTFMLVTLGFQGCLISDRPSSLFVIRFCRRNSRSRTLATFRTTTYRRTLIHCSQSLCSV